MWTTPESLCLPRQFTETWFPQLKDQHLQLRQHLQILPQHHPHPRKLPLHLHQHLHLPLQSQVPVLVRALPRPLPQSPSNLSHKHLRLLSPLMQRRLSYHPPRISHQKKEEEEGPQTVMDLDRPSRIHRTTRIIPASRRSR